jgi:pyruvate/2-oxoglutarate/acetoin dehydrogenase E1 component
MSIREISFDEAIYEALDEEMQLDDNVFLMGEDLRHRGLTQRLYKKYNERVIDTPIAESGFTGAAVGAAIVGMRPVVCHSRSDFMLYAFDSIANQASKWRFQTGNSSKLPLVVRSGTGGHRGSGCHHSQSLEALFLNVPGIDIAIPSTPYDAKGLLKTALRSEKPVLFFEHGMLKRIKGPAPETKYTVPFGEANIKAEGEDVTIVATAFMVINALTVAERMGTEGISVEVLDPRTIVPLDREAIIRSVKKTGRLITVEEGCMRGGIGSEVAAVIAESIPNFLEAPVVRVANPDAIIPYKIENEAHVLPQEDDIEKAIRKVLKS